MDQPWDIKYKLDLQEHEYRLPIHWLLWKAGLAGYLRKTRLMADMLLAAAAPGGRALDLGCGDGRGTSELAGMLGADFQFEGIDFSSRAIAFARLMAPQLEFHVQDGKALAYPEDSFALVVAREVIEHIPPAELATFLAEVRRVLQPGGYLLLTTPSQRRRVPPKHFQHFSPEQLSSLLTSCGFKVTHIRGFGWWPHPQLERPYRLLLSLPMLWRIHSLLGTHETPLRSADCLLVLACKEAR